MEFALIIKLILVGMMIFSALSYMFQRSDHKQSLKNAINNHESTRQLTEQEFELLKPYLNNKDLVKPYKYQSSLVSQDVSVITGSCVRHSLTTNGAESSYYFVIGNIEVFFPYGMDSYTMTDNIAEVVFTERYAFVISLNGFDLATAKAERDAESLRNEQWSQGSRGQFKTVTDDEINHIAQQEHDAALDELIVQAKNRRCEILDQRDETSVEHARKNKQNNAILTVIFLVLATIFALIYDDDSDLWMVIVSAISLVIAAICYWHKPKRQLAKVNRIRGTVEDNNHIDHSILVGDSLVLTYPKHWQAVLPAKTSLEADMDATVNEKELLRYGHTLSISKEIEQYGPPKFWGRNCFLFITGLVLSGFIYLLSSSLSADALLAYRFLTGQVTSWNINEQSTLQQAPIEKGDWVNLSLNGASCDVTVSYRCDKVFIDNQPVDLSDIMIALPDWAQKLSNGTLVVTERDSQVEMLEMYEKLYKNLSGNNNNYYGNNYYNNNQKTYTKLLHIDQLVSATDDACKTDNAACSRLKEIFTALLPDKQDNEFETWAEVVEYAKTQKDASTLIYITLGNEIARLFSTLSEQIFTNQVTQLLAKLGEHQQNKASLALRLPHDYFAEVKTQRNDLADRYDIVSNARYYYDILASAAGHVDIYGLVSDITYQDDGTIASLTIHPDYRYKLDDNQSMPASLVNIIFFVIIATVTILQAVIWLWKVSANRRRLARIQNDYRNLVLLCKLNVI